MTYRKALLGAAGLALTAIVAGCASSTAGHASFAGAGGQGDLPSGLPSGFPTKLPSGGGSLPSGVPTDLPSGLPTALPSGDGGDSGSSSGGSGSGSGSSSTEDVDLCAAISKSDLQDIMGSDATAQHQHTACNFGSRSKNVSILVDVFHHLDAAEDKQQKGGSDITVGGHPGVVLRDHDVVVSLGEQLSDPGELYAFNSDAAHVAEAKKLLAKIITRF